MRRTYRRMATVTDLCSGISEGVSQQSRFHDYSHDQLDPCLQVKHCVKGMPTAMVGECGRLVGAREIKTFQM